MTKSAWNPAFWCFVAALGLPSCGECHDDDEAANGFLAAPENRVCQTDADCVVVSTGCAELAGSFCGQAQLSASAAASSRWRELKEALSDCHGSSCVVCDAALQPRCSDGFCEGR